MGGSGSRSAQELHRSPPCTSLHLPPARRQPRTAVGLPKCRHGPPKALSQQQCRRITVQKNSVLRDGEVAVGRLRAGCESFQGYGDVSWPAAQVADVKAQGDLGTQRCLQHDGSFLWKTGSGVISEMAHFTPGKQGADKPVARPRSPRQREAPRAGRKGTAPAVGHVAERCPAAARPPQPPPPEPPPAAAAAAHSVDAAPRLRVCHDASASYAESSTSSRSSLAPDDSGISSSPSRVSLENRHDDCEGEECAKSRSPRPPAWKVRGFHEDELPNDLHRRFCEEIKSRYELQTEEDRRRRVLAIKRIDAMVSQRMASSVGREIVTPDCRLRRRSQRCWVTSANKGGDRSNSSEMRSLLSSSAAEGKSANSEGRKSAQSGRDDITAIRGEVLLGQYPKFMLTNSYKGRLQQQADKNHYGSLNDASARQLPEDYSPENNQERRHICDIFSKKLRKKTSETEKDDAHKADMCLKHVKEKRKGADKGSMPNEWRNARGETESVNRTLDLSEFQTMTIRGKRCGQDKRGSIIVHDWYGEGVGLHKQEQNEPDNLLLRDGQWDQNDIKDLGTETPQRDLEQSDSRNVEEGNVSAQGSATSDLAARAMLRKDSVVMQLLLGGYFKQQHNQPCWPRIGALRRTSNQLDVSIRSCRDPVQKQSVETQTLPVHVSRRLTHVDEPRVESAPKIEINHRGGRTRYYCLGRESSMGSLLSNRTPASPRGPQAGAIAEMPDEERRPSYLVQEMPPLAPSCASQRSHSDRSSHGRGPNAQWISPDTAFISSHYNTRDSMAQSLPTHMCGNSTSSDRPRGLPLKSEPEVNSGSHYRNTTSKSNVARSSRDQRKEGYRAVEHEERKKSLWSGQIVPVSHSTPQEFALNEADTLFSIKKNSAETTNVGRLELPDRKPLRLEEELASVSLDTYNQYNHRQLLSDPPADFSRDSKDRSMPFSNPNAHGDEICHRSGHWGEGETKQKLPKQHTDQQYQDTTRRRFTHRQPRHSRHHRNSARRTKQEDNIAESDSGSEERTSQPNIHPVRRVAEETNLSNSCRGKDNFDNLDNVLQANVTSDCKGGSKHHFRHHPHSERLVKDERKKETRDDTHLLIGSTGHSSDSVTRSSVSLLCHCCREEEEATSLDQCNVRKFHPDRKKIEKRNSRRSVDQPLICATEKKPSATVVRNSDCRVNQERPYERNDSQDEDIPYCRSSCCCTCHKTHHRPRCQPDVSGWQATHVAKRAHCSGTASASDTPCCCQDQQSVQCGAGGCDLCSACRRELRSRGDGPASERRSFHECYCGSRRVCYSILEDEEEAAAAEEAQGSGCGFARALSFFHNHGTGDWSQ